jgi:hypothetical protein
VTPVPANPTRRDARPTFLGIGAQKCASTWLHRILAAHPQVTVPTQKEVDFFSYRYDRGYQWYERQIGELVAAAPARGEISPSYFHEPAVPARVARYVPDARILVSLRDPVERALSNHRHEVRAAQITGDVSFEAGLANNPMYLEQGLYATHLRRWLRHFPRERVLVLLAEDVARDPLGASREVFRFLGIDEQLTLGEVRERYNASYVPRSRGLGRVKDALYGATRLPATRWAWDVAAGLGLRSLYRRVNHAPVAAVLPPPRPETLAALRARFEPEVRDLEVLLGRPLQGWLQRPAAVREAA